MATYEEYLEHVDTASQRPLEMEQDGRRAKQYGLRDQIAMLRYKKAAGLDTSETTSDGYASLGVRINRIQPGGSA